MKYWSGLVGGLTLHVVLVFLKFAKCSKLSLLLVSFKLLVGDPDRQRPYGKPTFLPPNLVASVAYSLYPGLFCLHSSPVWPPSQWLQQ